ncbi:hypothetical protein HPB52_015597 [Rhipicephalus sanguineus]|uniref:MARVEL domain-containing protein n=1 Tax=Rhipicephalus sanguineus TaxID=34632 RepID=A0A9D4YQE0_RHISA|nr:hypothetical protein HPB52_015597 [Rhipicephalus sanguineus]
MKLIKAEDQTCEILATQRTRERAVRFDLMVSERGLLRLCGLQSTVEPSMPTIGADRGFMATTNGLLRIAEITLGLCGLICIESISGECYYAYIHRYEFSLFVVITSFLFAFLVIMVFVLRAQEALARCFNVPLSLLVSDSFIALFYLIVCLLEFTAFCTDPDDNASTKVAGMAVAHFEAKGVSVPTVAEGRWATLLARQVVPPAQDKEGLEAKLHDEDKQEEAEQGEKSNEGGVDPSRASEEASWDAEDYKVSATEVSTIGEAEDRSRGTEATLIVEATDNHNIEADAENVFAMFAMMCFVVSSYFSYKFFQEERLPALPPPGLHAATVTQVLPK